MAFNPFCDKPRKKLSVNGQGATCRQRCGFSALKKHRAQNPHFIFEHARGAVREVRAERIRTNEFSQIVSLMRSCLQGWAHFEESHFKTALCGLISGLTSSKPTSDNE